MDFFNDMSVPAKFLLAFIVAGLIVLAIGENPLEAVQIMLTGALGSGEGLGYTLYYATNFVFTGLAVALDVFPHSEADQLATGPLILDRAFALGEFIEGGNIVRVNPGVDDDLLASGTFGSHYAQHS
jgi:hypothetical protein